MERAALTALFRATHGAYWNKSDHWDTDAELSRWHGVEVNDQGSVVKLLLYGNNLKGKQVLATRYSKTLKTCFSPPVNVGLLKSHFYTIFGLLQQRHVLRLIWHVSHPGCCFLCSYLVMSAFPASTCIRLLQHPIFCPIAQYKKWTFFPFCLSCTLQFYSLRLGKNTFWRLNIERSLLPSFSCLPLLCCLYRVHPRGARSSQRAEGGKSLIQHAYR